MRELRFSESAEQRFNDLQPSMAEVDAVVVMLGQLRENPNLGYKVPFTAFSDPGLQRIDVGRFAIHYRVRRGVVEIGDVFLP